MLVRRVAPLSSVQPTAAAALASPARRYAALCYANCHRWTVPGGMNAPRMTREELESIRYYNTKSREQWDYNRIDDTISSASEFRDKSKRPWFDLGQREDNSTLNSASMHTPSHYRLHKHFDAYSRPDEDSKVGAARAVREVWDAEEGYYPGEAFRKNRPGFRSAPRELLNRDTWYHWSDFIMKNDEFQATQRSRAWNPQWPPPGLTIPKFHTKKEFVFGAEDPALIAEVERWAWFKVWVDMNYRLGWREVPVVLVLVACVYVMLRTDFDVNAMRSMFAGQLYPGRSFIRSEGVPKDWSTGLFWWQRPLEQFPNKGEIFWMNRTYYGYENYLKERDAAEAAAAAAAAA